MEDSTLQQYFVIWINEEKNIVRKLVKKIVYKSVFPILKIINEDIEENVKKNKEENKKEHDDIIDRLEQVNRKIEKRNIKDGDRYYAIDYFDFENHFRGSEELIKTRQLQYLPFFLGRKNVIDFGCGRGEFLDLLKENGVGARGVDAYYKFAQYCKEKHLDVMWGDGLEYLKKESSIDGMFVGQVIEHMEIEQIIELCTLAYDKMEEGSYLIMETPNPKVLGVYAESFYLDPSHVKPVHPSMVYYLLEKIGFKEIQIRFTEESKFPMDIPELNSSVIENLNEFNAVMKGISNLLFGSQDYAIIAKR